MYLHHLRQEKVSDYYRYKGIDEVTVPSTSSLTDTDGQPYKYIGYYVGEIGRAHV